MTTNKIPPANKITKLLYIDYEVDSSIYGILFNTDSWKERKIKLNETIMREFASQLCEIPPLYRTSFIPNRVASLNDSELENTFLNEKFGEIHIDYENYNYDDEKQKLYCRIELSVDLNKIEEITIEDIESIIYDSFNSTYSSEKYKFILNTVETTDELFNAVQDKGKLEVYFEVLETPTNINFEIQSPTTMIK